MQSGESKPSQNDPFGPIPAAIFAATMVVAAGDGRPAEEAQTVTDSNTSKPGANSPRGSSVGNLDPLAGTGGDEHEEAEEAKPRRGRRLLIRTGVALLVVAAAVVALYYRQVASITTHVVGPPEHTFPATTFPPGALPELRFAAVGDVGIANEEIDETASAMYDTSQNDPYDALLVLGDNAYPDGDPALLDQTIFGPFAPVLDEGARLFAVLGNHDVMAPDGGLAQLERLGLPGRWWSSRIGDVLLIGLDTNRPDDPEQLRWLVDTLAAATSPWRIVMFHQGPYSTGYQGSDTAVRDIFTPVFARYGVQLVISGHEHDYERSVPLDGVTYLVSGAGAEVRRTGTEGYTAYSAATFHFLDINVFPDRLYIQAINHEGRMFDEVTIPQTGSADPVAAR